jgi:hypothetical protein
MVLRFDFLAEGQILEIFEPKEVRHFPSNIFQVSPSPSFKGCVCLCVVVKHVFVFVCIGGKLEDLAKETNLQVQSNVISMLGMKLVTTPPPEEPSLMSVF